MLNHAVVGEQGEHPPWALMSLCHRKDSVGGALLLKSLTVGRQIGLPSQLRASSLAYNETAYREEVKDLAVWCQGNNLSLIVIKRKEIIVDYRKRRTEHTPILIDGAVVEQVESFKFLGVHITNKL